MKSGKLDLSILIYNQMIKKFKTRLLKIYPNAKQKMLKSWICVTLFGIRQQLYYMERNLFYYKG